jgi:hypothetical protein
MDARLNSARGGWCGSVATGVSEKGCEGVIRLSGGCDVVVAAQHIAQLMKALRETLQP